MSRGGETALGEGGPRWLSREPTGEVVGETLVREGVGAESLNKWLWENRSVAAMLESC